MHRSPYPRLVPTIIESLELRVLFTQLPAGFTETLVTTGSDFTSPTAMNISQTGQIWVLEQAVNLRLVRPDGTWFTAMTLSVNHNGERGLLGMAFDPTYDGAGPNEDRA